jgi:hypothetical protein
MPEIEYELHGVEMLEFKLNRKPVQGFAGQKFQFDITAGFQVNDEQELIFAVITIIVRDFEKPQHLAELITTTVFKVGNFGEVILKDTNGHFIIPNPFEIHIRNLAISTARGILYSQLRGSYLHKAILPLIVDLVPIPAPQ